jgi:NAD(P)-dependent dehydrogenase (short-subunit alcohol dehydrogenase family)
MRNSRHGLEKQMDLGLNGKVAIVTGAARGIGQAIADRLAAEGARLACVDLRNAEFIADVADWDAVSAMVEKVTTALGPIDILVNNAGIPCRKTVLEVSIEEWDRVIRTNLYGCFYCSRAVASRMVAEKRRGAIVNISSIHGLLAKESVGPYSASKGAINMLTRQLAAELGRYGIRVNAVAPGAIATEINPQLYSSTDPKDVAVQVAMKKRFSLDRFGAPDDIANMVAFLASDLVAPYVTGAINYVDAGYNSDGTPRV